jgi:hypothetical protein
MAGRWWLLTAAVTALAVAVPLALAGSFSSAGSITGGDATQDGRLVAGDPASTCATPQPPSSTSTGTLFHLDRYTFQNGDPVTRCETITLNPMTCTGGSNAIQSGAYTPSFSSANVSTNYLGDIGSSPGSTKSYSVNLSSGAAMDVTVNEVTANGGCSLYGLTVTGTNLVASATLASSGAIELSDSDQTGRLGRNDPETTCSAATTAGVFDTATYDYDRYSFRNTAAISECMTITLDPMSCLSNLQIHSAAYSPGFNPAAITANYLGDIGASPTPPKSYSVNVPAGATFDVTVNPATAGANCSGYALTVSGFGLAGGVPTAASMLSFGAERGGTGVTLRWRTAGEAGTLGYNLYRERGDLRVRANPRLIPAAGTSGLHVYAWLDRRAGSASRYWLQRVSLRGSRDWIASAPVGRR